MVQISLDVIAAGYDSFILCSNFLSSSSSSSKPHSSWCVITFIFVLLSTDTRDLYHPHLLWGMVEEEDEETVEEEEEEEEDLRKLVSRWVRY